MTSLTIYDLDEAVAARLRARARAQGISVNQLAKDLVEQALEVRPAPSENRKHFEKLLGSWSRAEKAEFDRAVADFERVEKI